MQFVKLDHLCSVKEDLLKLRTLSAFVVSTALLLSLSAAAQDTWQIDPKHTAAQFSVRHLGISTVRGEFSKVSDNALRSPHFFEVQKYPTITFQSKKVEAVGADKLKVTGDLTMHGVTK